MAAAAILDFSEVKCDVIGSHGRPVSTSTPNFVKIAQRAAELFYVFSKWRSAAILDFFAEVKCGGISISGTSVLVTERNFVRICEIATELWPFK